MKVLSGRDDYRLEKMLPLQFPLVNHFYKHCGYRVNCGKLEQVYCLRSWESGHIVAALRFLPQQDYWILRNLCVVPSRRRQGLARLLMQLTLCEVGQPAENPGCYCFVLGYLESFYQSLGFECLDQEQMPIEIAESYRRYSQHQPDLKAMVLIRQLNFF